MPEDEEGIQFDEAQGGGSHSGDHEHLGEKHGGAEPAPGAPQAGRGPEEILESMSRPAEPMLPESEPVGREAGKRPGNGNGHGKSKERRFAASVEGSTVNVRGLVAVARAEENATVKGASGVVMSGDDSTFTGGAAVVSGGGNMTLTGGAAIVAARDEVDIDKGGAAMVAANKVNVSDHGYVAFAFARKIKVKDGGRVLITVAPALVIAGGIALSALALKLLTDRKLRNEIAKDVRRASRRMRAAGRTAEKRVSKAGRWLESGVQDLGERVSEAAGRLPVRRGMLRG